MLILIVNSGSSSVKCLLLRMPAPQVLARGVVERVGTSQAAMTQVSAQGAPEVTSVPAPSHEAALQLLLGRLTVGDAPPLRALSEVDAVGHRFVHGGEWYGPSALVTDEMLATLTAHADLAPLHSPPNLAGIRACQAALPGCPQVCAFDNGFHASLPPEAYLYALPYDLYERHRIRRYGFHGLAFRSALDRAALLLGQDVLTMRVVTLMLGSGNTANASDRGRSVEVSTGFTPQEGLVQSTRAGDLDAAIVPWLMEREGLGPAEVSDLLNRHSGWSGLSGLGQDLRDVIAAADEGHERARLALEVHAHRARKYVGAYAATMGGLDLLVFAGSVGLRAPGVRQRICRGLGFLGLDLDPACNDAATGEAIVSTPDSPHPIVAVEVDEELVIAQDAYRLVSGA